MMGISTLALQPGSGLPLEGCRACVPEYEDAILPFGERDDEWALENDAPILHMEKDSANGRAKVGCFCFADERPARLPPKKIFEDSLSRDFEEKRPTTTLKDGSEYTGYWRGDVRHGQGILVSLEGWKYEGHFEDDQAHGHGLLTTSDGMSYDGQWFQGERHGIGKCSFADGSVYEGEWRHHEKSGEGVEKYGAHKHVHEQNCESADGTYTGQFQNNVRDGHGIYVYSDGRKYVGQFAQGQFHGSGALRFADEAEYKGGFFRGRKHGMGSFMWPDGRRYVGIWNEGQTDGKGVVVEPGGSESRADVHSIQSAFFIADTDEGVREQPHESTSWPFEPPGIKLVL